MRRKFRSQTSDHMDRWKSSGGKSQRGEAKKWEDQRRERVRRKKMQVREKKGTSRFTVFFKWFVARDGRKVNSLKRQVRSQLAKWEMKKCTPLWREANFEVKTYKTYQVRTTCWSGDVEKVHAVVARSTFSSQNVQNVPGPDHLLERRCRKSARCCGAKHISKSKCRKRTRSGPLVEVEMSKKCTPLWREAQFQVKIHKTPRFGRLLEVEMSKKCTPLWREAHFQVKIHKKHQHFDVQKSKKCTPLGREAHFQVKSVKQWRSRTTFKTEVFDPLFDVQTSKKCTLTTS